MIFFLKGTPNLWLVMVTLSLGISLLERALNRGMRFIRVPQIAWPLMCLTVVVAFTAYVNVGIGLRAFGSEVMGGKKYVFLVVGIFELFRPGPYRIPPERAKLYPIALSSRQVILWRLATFVPSPRIFEFWYSGCSRRRSIRVTFNLVSRG